MKRSNSSGKAKSISLKRALEILKKISDAELVHIAYTDRGDTRQNYICSCCSCCCYSFAAIQRFGFGDALISSEMIAELDARLCNNCVMCVNRCHFRARTMKRE